MQNPEDERPMRGTMIAVRRAVNSLLALWSRQSKIRSAVAVPATLGSQTLGEAAGPILESISEPLLLLDSASRVLFANRASQVFIRHDAVGKPLVSVLRMPALLHAVQSVQDTGEPQKVAFTVPIPVRQYFEAHVSRTAGRVMILHIRDVSDIRRADELRADFVANASHELRTPLAALTGFIDTLRGHAKDDPEARERFLEIMSTEAGRMRRLIDDLLSLTKIELNEHYPPSGEVDVVSTICDAADALKPLADSAHVTLDIEPRQQIYAIGDRDELTQLFQNVLHNAIKYGRDGGHVRVRFGITPTPGESGEKQISVAIEDEGEGIPREAIPRLTERFYRVDVKRSREKGGTGLGLAIVKHILNRHRGRLEIESTPGRGSIFTTYLPASARMAAEQ
jgi:two-component system, OmpR family, phosphate regulon sensor histidine kinase PhoR